MPIFKLWWVEQTVSGACFIRGDNNIHYIISFNDIKQTYELDKQNHKSRYLIKIVDNIFTQLFFKKCGLINSTIPLSSYMSVTIQTCIQTGQIQRNTSNSIDFIEFINHSFNSFNSRFLYRSNSYLCTLNDSDTVNILLGGS